MEKIRAEDFYLEDKVERFFGSGIVNFDNIGYKMRSVCKICFWMYQELMKTRKQMKAMETMFGLEYDEEKGEYHGRV